MTKAHQLRQTLFPVGHLTKQEVRQIAGKQVCWCLTRRTPGICFIGERRFKQFLQQYLPAQPGTW